MGEGVVSHIRWTTAENDYLEQMVGDVPFPVLVRRMKIAATANGWPLRTDKAISQRIRRIGQLSGARHGDWTTTGGVGEILGCPGTRVEAWLRRKCVRDLLDVRKIGKRRYVERRGWRRLAKQMPRILGGFSADVLFLLLEDRELADAVAAAHPRPIGDWRVRCVETGQVFANAGASAIEYHMSNAAISMAIRRRRPVPALGLTFEALRQPSLAI
jgi:hypothetical protein